MLPDLFRLIGSDRYLSPDEVSRATEPHALTASAWDVYTTHFQAFTGATLDPRFHRLAHPATLTGRVKLVPETTVVVVGTGPSLVRQIHALRGARDRMRVFTSPHGAAMLQGHGVVADLVLVDHSCSVGPKGCPLVAADWRTPRELLAGVANESLFVPSPLPTWGFWAATAVALAADAGASRIALLGLDEEQTALTPLLELIARLAPFTAFDCCIQGAGRRGWVPALMHEVAGTKQVGRLETSLWRAQSREERELLLRDDLAELAPILDRARRLHASAALDDGAVAEIIAWREQPRLRVLLQESLGISLLPRLWRLQPDESLARSRRVRLALSEIVSQADAFAAAA
jgi:hypothetical protein